MNTAKVIYTEKNNLLYLKESLELLGFFLSSTALESDPLMADVFHIVFQEVIDPVQLVTKHLQGRFNLWLGENPENQC